MQNAGYTVRIDDREVKTSGPATFKDFVGQGPSPLFAKVLYADPALREDRLIDPDQLDEPEGADSNWKLHMLNDYIEGDCEIKLVGFEDKEAV